jgi:hypothetical protein
LATLAGVTSLAAAISPSIEARLSLNVSGRGLVVGNCDNLTGLRDWTLPLRGEDTPPMPFSDYRDNFDPETLAIVEAAFNEAWEVLSVR